MSFEGDICFTSEEGCEAVARTIERLLELDEPFRISSFWLGDAEVSQAGATPEDFVYVLTGPHPVLDGDDVCANYRLCVRGRLWNGGPSAAEVQGSLDAAMPQHLRLISTAFPGPIWYMPPGPCFSDRRRYVPE